MDAGDGRLINHAKNGNDDEKDAFGRSVGYSDGSVVARMPTAQRSTHYNMTHTRRGMAIIFNHEHFNVSDLKNRAGTQSDCECLAERLKHLNFELEIYNDLNYKDLMQVISKAAAADHTNHDCFILCVMSHGDTGILYAKDSPYKPENLWLPFTADKCTTLAGKPKIFFIQACQGSNLDKGVTLSRTETDGQPHSYRIPTHADFLIAYSTVIAISMAKSCDNCFQDVNRNSRGVFECLRDLGVKWFCINCRVDDDEISAKHDSGFYSWRNTTRGSWFIQALCEELKENQYRMDLLTLLVFVCQRVALDYESNVPDTAHMHRQKQIPCVTSMLTRLIQFSPK